MKKYIIELSDELSTIYEDIAKMSKKDVEEWIPIILEKVIRTLINQSNIDKGKSSYKKNGYYDL